MLAERRPVQVKDLERTPAERSGLYVDLHLKLVAVVAIALAWAGFSLWLSIPWIAELAQSITLPLAIMVIAGIAILPGYLNANLIASLLIGRPPPLRFEPARLPRLPAHLPAVHVAGLGGGLRAGAVRRQAQLVGVGKSGDPSPPPSL